MMNSWDNAGSEALFMRFETRRRAKDEVIPEAGQNGSTRDST
jgi:hypothetical protein